MVGRVSSRPQAKVAGVTEVDCSHGSQDPTEESTAQQGGAAEGRQRTAFRFSISGTRVLKKASLGQSQLQVQTEEPLVQSAEVREGRTMKVGATSAHTPGLVLSACSRPLIIASHAEP